jgi:hypothetical protein
MLALGHAHQEHEEPECAHRCSTGQPLVAPADPSRTKCRWKAKNTNATGMVMISVAANLSGGLFLGLAGVALLVGGIGVANTMVISVLERRREIGLPCPGRAPRPDPRPVPH